MRSSPHRHHAWAALQIACETAFELLALATNMVKALKVCSSSPADQQLACKSMTAMCDTDFLTAVGHATAGLVATAHLARSETTAVRQLRIRGAEYGTADAMVLHEVLAAMAVEQANVLAELAADVLVYRLETEVEGAAGTSGGGRDGGGSSSGRGRGSGSSSGQTSSIPDDLGEHIMAVLHSRLSTRAAGAIVVFPDLAGLPAVLPNRPRSPIRELLCEAARKAAAGMFKLITLRNKLLLLPNADAHAVILAANLQLLAREEPFQRLQVGMAGPYEVR